MSISYQWKTLYCNVTSTDIVTSTGAQANTPTFFYNSYTNIKWYIRDQDLTPIDLTGAIFTFKLAPDYVQDGLITLDNPSFVLTDWSGSDKTQGKICMRLDMNNPDILTLLNDTEKVTAYFSLWARISGVDYCLAASDCVIKNLVF